ncbi:hypothetical protein HHL19_35355 [Streptomyces sp. R302]|uniref:phage tail tube protein n=1 Tax=unclassified Streptomyces TaxID=2593676 RepID=UPI00145EA170|nr:MULTISPECIES: hypothetical protein [unclassified Streptomyces]NML55181.1 hypothetical protein [Streptomyces sp. R301]NML83789.1 hypothetical protein [Streptomyces sp. R302]
MAGETANPNQLVIPQIARLWLAAVGTAAPADATVAMPAGWQAVGYTNPDSLKFNTEPSFETVKSHQASLPTRIFQTDDAATIEIDLQQWSGANFRAVYGGGTITEVTPSGGTTEPKHYKFVPPRIGGRSETAACIEIADGSKHYRYMFPRTMQMEGVATDLAKAKEATLPLRLAVQGGDDLEAWYTLTDDPAFAPVP